MEAVRTAYQTNEKRWKEKVRKEQEKKDNLLKQINELKNSISRGWQSKRKMEVEKENRLSQSEKLFRVKGICFFFNYYYHIYLF